MAEECYLRLQNIVKIFPGVVALDDVSFDLRPGEVHSLVGENGAGKSTLIKVLAGAFSPEKGNIELFGNDYTALTPWKAKELGIEVIYQELNLMPALSVAENIFLTDVRGKRFFINPRDFEKKTRSLYNSIGINYINPKSLVKDLSPASLELVEIAKAISKPTTRILVMDEPTAPLTNIEVEILFKIIQQLKEKKISIIYISHRVDEIFRISDRVTVLRDGHVIKTMNAKDTNRAQLVELMVGRKLNENFPPRTSPVGDECVLRVENVTGGRVRDISFELFKGEILGVGGLVGAGRTEMVRMIYGADKKKSGHIFLNGKEISIRHPTNALHKGIALVPEDRKQHGIVLAFSVKENISLSIMENISTFSFINRKKEHQTAEHYKELLGIKTLNINTLVRTLSGGNQQKVALGKSLATNSKVIILDEPTRGIDVGAKLEIYHLMRKLCQDGISIILISSEMDELLAMSDRIIVLSNGQIAGTLDKKDATQERILTLATDADDKESHNE